MLRNLPPLLALVLIAAVFATPNNAFAQAACRYYSDARPDSVVPPTQSSGLAWFSSEPTGFPCGDPDSVRFFVGYSDLESPVTGAQIRRGAARQNGELVYTLFNSTFASGASVLLLLDPSPCPDIFEGNLYFVVSTQNYPDGAVRDQVKIECWAQALPVSWGHVRALFR